MTNEGRAEPGVYPAEAPRIRDLPAAMQPREVLETRGAEAVEEDVLLAVLLRTGLPHKNVRELAREILTRYQSLAELSRASLQELTRIKGIGKVKALTLMAAFEFGRRVRDVGLEDSPLVRTPQDVAKLLRSPVDAAEVEMFWMLPLNKKNRMITKAPVQVTKGVLDASLIHQREVFLQAIRANSSAVVLAHNHPSGDPAPSAEDLAITRQMVASGRIIGIRVLDHVILGRPGGEGRPGYFSVREAGLVDFEN